MEERETDKHSSMRVDFRYPVSMEYEQSCTEPSPEPSFIHDRAPHHLAVRTTAQTHHTSRERNSLRFAGTHHRLQPASDS